VAGVAITAFIYTAASSVARVMEHPNTWPFLALSPGLVALGGYWIVQGALIRSRRERRPAP
jgi:hypothetical protein